MGKRCGSLGRHCRDGYNWGMGMPTAKSSQNCKQGVQLMKSYWAYCSTEAYSRKLQWKGSECIQLSAILQSWQTTFKSERIWVRKRAQFDLTDNFQIWENMSPTKTAVWADRQLQNLREYESDKESSLSWQTTSKSERIYGSDKESSLSWQTTSKSERIYGSDKERSLSWQTTSKSERIWVRQRGQFQLTDNLQIWENMGDPTKSAV